MTKNTVAVKAQKILKNGKISTSAKTFKSIAEAAAFVTKGTNTKVATARANICSTSKGREARNPKDHNRNKAYGYVWSRA